MANRKKERKNARERAEAKGLAVLQELPAGSGGVLQLQCVLASFSDALDESTAYPCFLPTAVRVRPCGTTVFDTAHGEITNPAPRGRNYRVTEWPEELRGLWPAVSRSNMRGLGAACLMAVLGVLGRANRRVTFGQWVLDLRGAELVRGLGGREPMRFAVADRDGRSLLLGCTPPEARLLVRVPVAGGAGSVHIDVENAQVGGGEQALAAVASGDPTLSGLFAGVQGGVDEIEAVTHAFDSKCINKVLLSGLVTGTLGCLLPGFRQLGTDTYAFEDGDLGTVYLMPGKGKRPARDSA